MGPYFRRDDQLLKFVHLHVLASRRYRTLDVGVTNSLQKRLEQHRNGEGSLFVKTYNVHQLVHVESYDCPDEAIAREKST
jgi:putative endonuclease